MNLTEEQRDRLAHNYLVGMVERERATTTRALRLRISLPTYWRIKRGYKPDQCESGHELD